MIQINLPEDIERQLRDRAARVGQDIGEVIVEALRETVTAAPRIDFILAPFRSAFAQSGSSDEELDQDIETARLDVWQAKQRP